MNGVRIGVLPTHFHDVSGTLYAESEYDFCIDLFNYDGLGPGIVHACSDSASTSDILASTSHGVN